MKKKRPLKKWKLAFLSVAALILVLSGIRLYNLYRFHLAEQTRFMMDTYVTIYAVGPEKVTAPAIDSALDRMQEIDNKFNSQNPQSPIYAFNHQGIPISDPEIVAMVRLALQIARDTGGAFDITIAPLIELWGFYGDAPHVPEPEAIKDCLNRVGYQHLAIKNGTLQKNKTEVRIDLGGIAKGYALDAALTEIRKVRGSRALVSASGDKLVHWNGGLLSGAEQSTASYGDAEITWSGYLGDGTGPGHLHGLGLETTLAHPDLSLSFGSEIVAGSVLTGLQGADLDKTPDPRRAARGS